MVIDKQGPNVMVLTLHDGARILFSYSTPVAVVDRDGEAFKTARYYSRTTAGHVAKFLDGTDAATVNQEVVDAFAKGAR